MREDIMINYYLIEYSWIDLKFIITYNVLNREF